jgi:hypothetical protein
MSLNATLLSSLPPPRLEGDTEYQRVDDEHKHRVKQDQATPAPIPWRPTKSRLTKSRSVHGAGSAKKMARSRSRELGLIGVIVISAGNPTRRLQS